MTQEEYPSVAARRPKILVTGATGFLGRRLVRRLAGEGYPLRALARKPSSAAALRDLGAEIAFGDLGDARAVAAAIEGVDIVVHAGAGTSGSAKDAEIATVLGTRNVLQACRANRVRKLVHVSSCNVYEVSGYTENQVITEEAQLERFPRRRGHYSAGKLQAEALVTSAMAHEGCRAVVLRPGTIYGPGAEVYTNLMGISLWRRVFVVLGDGENELPLVHVDNAVDAIVECIRNGASDNQIFNVVDRDVVTKRTYMDRLIRRLHPGAVVIYVPMSLLLAATWLQETLLNILGRQPFFTVYRLVSSQKCVKYSTARIECAIGWRSRIGFEQGAEQLIRAHGRATDAE